MRTYSGRPSSSIRFSTSAKVPFAIDQIAQIRATPAGAANITDFLDHLDAAERVLLVYLLIALIGFRGGEVGTGSRSKGGLVRGRERG